MNEEEGQGSSGIAVWGSKLSEVVECTTELTMQHVWSQNRLTINVLAVDGVGVGWKWAKARA